MLFLNIFSPALFSRASIATTGGAFNLPISIPCKTLKRVNEDHKAVQERIRSIEERSFLDRSTTNGGNTISWDDPRGNTNPPPKPPEQGSFNNQRSKPATTTRGGNRRENWKMGEARVNALPRLVRATQRIYCLKAPEIETGECYPAIISAQKHQCTERNKEGSKCTEQICRPRSSRKVQVEGVIANSKDRAAASFCHKWQAKGCTAGGSIGEGGSKRQSMHNGICEPI
ncbi:unnamed protein product [Linum trigynum]|uniref:Uncharacterized protein n=1 Tax=Linum trigynum TaxID=586398 RepID=A0AAV2EB34_9ROSI